MLCILTRSRLVFSYTFRWYLKYHARISYGCAPLRSVLRDPPADPALVPRDLPGDARIAAHPGVVVKSVPRDPLGATRAEGPTPSRPVSPSGSTGRLTGGPTSSWQVSPAGSTCQLRVHPRTTVSKGPVKTCVYYHNCIVRFSASWYQVLPRAPLYQARLMRCSWPSCLEPLSLVYTELVLLYS